MKQEIHRIRGGLLAIIFILLYAAIEAFYAVYLSAANQSFSENGGVVAVPIYLRAMFWVYLVLLGGLVGGIANDFKRRKAHLSVFNLTVGIVMVALGAAGLCFALIAQYFAARASQGTGTLMRRDFFAHINRLSYAEIDKIGTPSLITRITNDIDQLQVAVAMTIRLLLRVPFLIIGATIMAMTIDLKLSVVFLVAAPLIALTIYFVMSRAVPVYKKSPRQRLMGYHSLPVKIWTGYG